MIPLKSKYSFLIFIAFTISSCKQNKAPKEIPIPIQTKSIKIIPLGNPDKEMLKITCNKIKIFIPNLEVLPSCKLPALAYYQPRDRYRADSLIRWLSTKAKTNEIYVGITGNDISAAKGKYNDWGVMGLSYVPGKACVASYLRLKDKSNFYKVVIHEIGHSMGLPHCSNKTCFMRDAEGKDRTEQETNFCSNCKKVFSTN